VKRLLPVLLLLLAALYGVVALRPAWQAVVSAPHGRDYATYHYATLQALGDGSGTRGDPYDTAALGRLARAEHTRGTVHPYFYPPPFLLGMLWIAPPWRAPLSLAEGYRAWFWIQNACLLGVLIGLWRWFRAHPLLLGLLAVTFTPIPDNLKMGQANLPVLLLVVWGLAGRSGALVGAAAMAKMSPALYLVGWAAQRRWRPVLVAVATALVLSLLPLPLELIGGSADEQSALGELPPNVRLRPPVPYVQVPDLLSRSAALLLPLADNLFGRHLTSPLKLWDYLATSVPIVAPDLPTVREIEAQTGVCLHRFEAADPAGLVHAVQRALSAPPRTPFVRTWADRARELLPVLLGEARPAP